MSRMNPRMRLENVATPITPAAFTSEWFSCCRETGETAVRSDIDRILAGYPESFYFYPLRRRRIPQKLLFITMAPARHGWTAHRDYRPARRDRREPGARRIFRFRRRILRPRRYV